MKQIVAILFLSLSSMLVQAQKAEIFSSGGVAIKGYDPVAFFKQSQPVKGQENLSYKWKDATWLFSSEENRASFEASPEKYAPQYGGYCAYGTAEGHKAPTETNTWTVVNDKLYFNYNKDVQSLWKKDQQNMIKKADVNWPKIKNDD